MATQGAAGYTNFGKGLVTDTTPLQYAEGTVSTIENLNVNTNGSVSTRKGI